jgi:hypothetical protein
MAQKAQHTRTLKITVENISPAKGCILTPLWFGFHDGTFRHIQVGSAASEAIQRLAEDGNVGPLANTYLDSRSGFVQSAVYGRDQLINNLIVPGGRSEAIVQVGLEPHTHRYFSYAAMIVPSNDAFIANQSPIAHEVFQPSGEFVGLDVTVPGSAIWDAGTEVNDEAVLHAPGAGPFVIGDAGVPENGVIRQHPGHKPGGAILSNPNFVNADFKAAGYRVARILIQQI